MLCLFVCLFVCEGGGGFIYVNVLCEHTHGSKV